MTDGIKYVHTNLVARDWRKLADFYQRLFGCVPLPPERDLKGDWLDKGTGIPGAHIRGAHLRLPGYGDAGPTLEIFQYEPVADAGAKPVNRPGFAHIAFQVDDVPGMVERVLAEGGEPVGETVALEVAGAGTVTMAYVTDPEGNIIELQRWRK